MDTEFSPTMKTMKILMAMAFAVAAVILTQRAMGADINVPVKPGALTPELFIQWLTPVIVPLVLAGFKQLAPRVPGWAIPLLAPVLGVVIDYVNHFATGHQTNFLVAVALGLTGVGLRELKDQIKPAPNGGWALPPA